ncbi:MAG TPA: hypothetical protein VL854_05700 [Nitrososphaeraceae archaeon]|nr:hypothetical protein [Nitrososphaeraceae archaeon]
MSDKNKAFDIINTELAEHPDAVKFIYAFSAYCHGIDDIIDGEIKDTEGILRVFGMAADVFTCPFWRQYGPMLYIVEKVINNDFSDSEVMKNSEHQWQRQHADVLRCSANNMLHAVLYLLCGREVARRVSLDIRTCSYFNHHDEAGNPH